MFFHSFLVFTLMNVNALVYVDLFFLKRDIRLIMNTLDVVNCLNTTSSIAKMHILHFWTPKALFVFFFCKDQLRLHAFREQSSTYLLCLLQETNFVCISSHLEVPIEHELSIWNNLWTHSANLKIAF